MKILKQKNKGFTLIELLVVISIIGLLSSVVLGSLSSARQKAKNTKVVSEMNQLKIAFDMYRTDKGKYPSEDIGIGRCNPLGWCGDDLVNFLNTELINNKYIKSIPFTNIIDPNGYQAYYLTGQDYYLREDRYDDYYVTCGNKKLKSYVFVFYYDIPLNFSKVGYYYQGSYENIEPWITWDTNNNYYCIGE